MIRFQRNSLRRRLIWQLLLFQAGFLILFVLAFVAYLIGAKDGGALVDPEITEIAARAIIRDDAGKLAIVETSELIAMRESAPDLWFVARSDKGEVVQYGPVPALYQDFGDILDRITFADIRDNLNSYFLSAVIRNVKGTAGHLTIMGKGNLLSMTFVVVVLSNLLTIPILGVLALITVFAIPFIVKRGFADISNVAAQAELIDIDSRGMRLSDQGVPAEVRPLVEAINRALRRLDEGYERQQRFILDAAHELRTPVAILQTRIEGMPESDFRTRVLADAARISALSEQLLDLQRIDKATTTFKPVDLTCLCETVVADLAPIAIAGGYQLALLASDNRSSVMGDEGALQRVLTNLVQNAIQHAGRQGTIWVKASDPGAIEVSDEGNGVPDGERERIFEPFHRVQLTDRGAGLGLNLVKQIVARHHGSVTVGESASGGASFRVTLPLTTRHD
ncbi:sensor histidine kinase [Brucella pseudogrignonensis]|uniref:histidine kinase n=1 Tax=Brucella pseudogrignonensis TaxID=419475 RepID=A0A256GAF4_9HYPH|nr:HAMP domain-containing sensor histidine kinase [Brucella pseudogrignonensis]OYR24092.1 his Kinase A domain protein [Brucella pseudogrignonensis]